MSFMGRARRAAPCRLGVVVAAGVALAAAARGADDGVAPPAASGARILRVGTSGDYPPFSLGDPSRGRAEGFGPEAVRRFARDGGHEIDWVRFRWPALEDDLRAGRFDLAVGGVTVRPERSRVGRFSAPVARTGAVVLARETLARGGLDGLDRPDVTLAVNAGGHLERAARARFPRATVRPVAGNASVPDEMAAGRADAVVTDTVEAPLWEARLPDAVRLGPFTRDRKAWLLSADAGTLAAEVDAWLAEREADGSLGALRERWLGADPGPSADPVGALLAALDERLSLMPGVAEAKRGGGRAVRDPAREAAVLAAAEADAADAARGAGLPLPPEGCVRRLFRAQMAAARALQHQVLASPPTTDREPPDLARESRPALERIGRRISEALVWLPPGLDPAVLEAEAARSLGSLDAVPAARAGLAAALPGCLREPASAGPGPEAVAPRDAPGGGSDGTPGGPRDGALQETQRQGMLAP